MKLGIIADIHEDFEGLKQALDILESHKCDKIICLGDIIGVKLPHSGYLKSKNASRVLNLLIEKCEIIVAGNHDFFTIKKLPKNKAGFEYPKNWYILDYNKREELAKNRLWLYESNQPHSYLKRREEMFINKLPEYFVGDFEGIKILLSHYAYPDLIGATKFNPKTPEDVSEHFIFMQKFGCRLSFSGHDHQEGTTVFTAKKIEKHHFGKLKVNPRVPTWIHVPKVAKTNTLSGMAIFDTKKFVVETIPLVS